MAVAQIKGHQNGAVIDYVNSGSSEIEAMSIVTFGAHIGIAAGTIPAGAKGALYTEGVFYIPKKASGEIAMGTDLYWDGSVATDAAGTVKAGYAIADAAADDKYAAVKIG